MSAMPSMAVRMAEPIAVPREVEKLLIAWTSRSASVVGGTWTAANPENATSPILGPPS